MFDQVISKTRHELLATLKSSGLLEDFYMAGGTAAALQIGHIRSLQYFDDAEKSPPLDMLKPVVWDEIRKFFVDETER